MLTIRRFAVAVGFLTAMAAIAALPVQASHQEHIVLMGNGNPSPIGGGGGSAVVLAPPGWTCTPPVWSGSYWEAECTRGDTWCAEPTVDVFVNGLGAPLAAVTGTSTCQAYTGGTPTQSVGATCIAVMPLGFPTGSCSGFSPGYVDGTSIGAVCRSELIGANIDVWSVDCGIISGP